MGSGFVTLVTCRISSSARPSTRPTARMMSVVSSKPLVVIRPTFAPPLTMTAFVATVLPCLTILVRPSSSRRLTSIVMETSSIAFMTPIE